MIIILNCKVILLRAKKKKKNKNKNKTNKKTNRKTKQKQKQKTNKHHLGGVRQYDNTQISKF